MDQTSEKGRRRLTGAVVVNHRHRLPLEEVHQVQDGPAQRGEVRVKVDVEDVPVVRHLVLPLGLDVRHPQGVADGLDRVGRGAVRRPKDGRHPQRELVTRWRRNTGWVITGWMMVLTWPCGHLRV